jgi:hypothetical protein
MGFIREPKGVDFVINSGSLSEEDRKEISLFIKNYKLRNKKTKQQKKAPVALGII